MHKISGDRTRFAPSPTGYPHLGSLMQSIIDKALALKTGGQFILRLEDTDQTRYLEGSEEGIYEFLKTFNLESDESPLQGGPYAPYKQSERLDIYKKYADELVEKGHAYYCFCTKDRLEELRTEQEKNKQMPMYDKKCRNIDKEEAKKRVENGESHVIRMKIPENEKITVYDLLRGDIEFETKLIDDQVIMKADGYPTYHLAVVVDDHEMKITHVVRGAEWITSFPKHKLLYDYFGWEMPVFIHTPLITNMDGSKMSKRQGHSSVDWYIWKGFLPEAVINFISLLGWSHPEEKEIFSFEEYVKVFNAVDLSAVNPKFDLVKLEWMNGQYIQNLTNAELITRIKNWLDTCLTSKYKGVVEYTSDWNNQLYTNFANFIDTLDSAQQELFAEINKERIKYFENLLPMNAFFLDDLPLDRDLIIKQKAPAELDGHLNWVLHKLEKVEWTLPELKKIESELIERSKEIGWKVGEVFYPIRVAVCRSNVSPPLFESIYLLGKHKTLLRISEAIDLI